MKVSIILPVYNEAESLEPLYTEIKNALTSAPFGHEIVAVNDGSRDGSQEVLDRIAAQDSDFKVVHLSKNYGQTAALSAGIDIASGDVLIPMDADMQNDPADISKFLMLIDEGYDVVAGWRKDRKDNIIRRVPSLIANWIISRITKVRLHDYGCTMKAYRKDIIKNVRFYGEMHRFMPVYVAWHGAKIKELVVNHRPRRFGKSKYGLSRTLRVILDLLTVKFLVTYLAKPMHFFGGAGVAAIGLSFVSGVIAIVLRLAANVHFIRTPLPLLTVFLATVGVQLILMGILAEILIRVYHEPQGKTTYTIRRTVNFDHARD